MVNAKYKVDDRIKMDQESLLGTKNHGIRQSRSQKLIRTFALCCAFMGLGLAIAVPGPTLASLMLNVSSTTAQISYIFPARSFGYLIGSVLGGLIFDRLEKRSKMLVACGLLLTAVGIGSAPWTSSLPLLCILLALGSVAMGFLDTGGNVMCLNLWGKDSGPYIQALHFAFGVGAFLAPLLAAPFLSSTGIMCTGAACRTSSISPPAEKLHKRQVHSGNVFTSLDPSLPDSLNTSMGPSGIFQSEMFTLTENFTASSNMTILSTVQTFQTTSTTPLTTVFVTTPLEAASPEIFQSSLIQSASPLASSVDITLPITVALNPKTEITSQKETVFVTQPTSLTPLPQKPKTAGGVVAGNKDLNSASGNNLREKIDKVVDSTNEIPALPITTAPMTATILTTLIPNMNTTNSSRSETESTATDVVGAWTTAFLNNSNVNASLGPLSQPLNETYNLTAVQFLEDSQTRTAVEFEVTTVPGRTEKVSPSALFLEMVQMKSTSASSEKETGKATVANTEAPLLLTQSLDASQPNSVLSQSTPLTILVTTTAYTTASQPTTSQLTTELSTAQLAVTPLTNTKITTAQLMTELTTQPTTILKSPANERGTITMITEMTQPLVTNSDLFPTLSAADGARVTAHEKAALEQSNSTDQSLDKTNSVTPMMGVNPLSTFTQHGEYLNPSFRVTKIEFVYMIVAAFLLMVSASFFCMEAFGSADKNTRSKDADGAACEQQQARFKFQLMSGAFVFFLLYVGSEVAYGQFIAVFSIQHSKFTERDGALLTSTYWGAFTLGRGIAIPFSRCASPTQMLVIALILTVVSASGLIVAMTFLTNVFPLWILSVAFGAGMSSVFPTGILWVEQHVKVSSRMASVMVVGSALGEMIIPAIVGYLFDFSGPMALLYTCLVCALASAVTFFCMHILVKANSSTYLLLSQGGHCSKSDPDINDELDASDSDDYDTLLVRQPKQDLNKRMHEPRLDLNY